MTSRLLHAPDMSDTNGVMMQYFHWYTPADGSLRREIAHNAAQLVQVGVRIDGDVLDIQLAPHECIVDRSVAARRDWAWGDQTDYFDDPLCIGRTYGGDEAHAAGRAVLRNHREGGEHVMQIPAPHSTYHDITETVVTDESEAATVRCTPWQVSV